MSIEISGGAVADLAEAEATIERFDASVGAALSGFPVIALRTEAVASSRIENLFASATSIALVEHLPKTPRGRSNAEAISANVATLRDAMERDTPIDAAEIIEIQRILLEQHAPQLTGKFRYEQVWMGGSNCSPHDAEHVAPQLAYELTEIREGWKERLTARSDSAVWLVLDQALKSPAISSTSIAADLDMTPHRARAAIEQLEDAGILHTNSKARRNKVWLVTDVIHAVEAFMDRTRRQRTG